MKDKITNSPEVASSLAFKFHEGQKDIGGADYIHHCIHVASAMINVPSNNDRELYCVGMLHDILEDTDCTVEVLAESGFSKSVIDAILCLTHNNGESYEDYIRRIKRNPMARRVKLADLTHNMDIRRLPYITDKEVNRLIKYHKAYNYLK